MPKVVRHISVRFRVAACIAICTLGCATSVPPAGQRYDAGSGILPVDAGGDELGTTCRDLLRSEPESWPERVADLLAFGDAATTPLADAIRAEPGQAGEQIAIAALGKLGGPTAEARLLELMDAAEPRAAAEAALALGRLPADDPQLRDRRLSALRHHVGNPSSDTVLRTAAAASLLRLGDREPAVPLVAAVLLADHPASGDLRARFDLPTRSRWALERTIAIDAIRDALGQDFDLDPDLAWPDLNERANRFRRAAMETTR